MTTPTKTLRLPPGLRGEIDRIARRARRSFSAVTQDLLEEALRMRSCPGVYFADEPAGREAKVAGTGLGVWEVIRDYLNSWSPATLDILLSFPTKPSASKRLMRASSSVHRAFEAPRFEPLPTSRSKQPGSSRTGWEVTTCFTCSREPPSPCEG